MKNPVKRYPSLQERRLEAAKASGGVSIDVIYDRMVEIVSEGDLRGSVLDYGAGLGRLTKRLYDLHRFERISGADILARPDGLPPEISWHCLDLNGGQSISEESFDAVVAAEVIEHLENPREIAREWFRILKPGGTLVVSTPNNESIRSLLSLAIRGHYVAFDDSCYPAHITALLRKDLGRVLTEAGFSGIRFMFSDSGGIPKFPMVSWQRISFALLKGCRFSDNVIAVATKLALRACPD